MWRAIDVLDHLRVLLALTAGCDDKCTAKCKQHDCIRLSCMWRHFYTLHPQLLYLLPIPTFKAIWKQSSREKRHAQDYVTNRVSNRPLTYGRFVQIFRHVYKIELITNQIYVITVSNRAYQLVCITDSLSATTNSNISMFSTPLDPPACRKIVPRPDLTKPAGWRWPDP